jgi:hypothetical protein
MKNKLDSLYQVARHNITVHRFMTMYELGEYRSLEDCLLEMVNTLANVNNSLTERLIEAESRRPRVITMIDGTTLTHDPLANKE